MAYPFGLQNYLLTVKDLGSYNHPKLNAITEDVRKWFIQINDDLGLFGLRLAFLFWDYVRINHDGTQEAKDFINAQVKAIQEIIPTLKHTQVPRDDCPIRPGNQDAHFEFLKAKNVLLVTFTENIWSKGVMGGLMDAHPDSDKNVESVGYSDDELRALVLMMRATLPHDFHHYQRSGKRQDKLRTLEAFKGKYLADLFGEDVLDTSLLNLAGCECCDIETLVAVVCVGLESGLTSYSSDRLQHCQALWKAMDFYRYRRVSFTYIVKLLATAASTAALRKANATALDIGLKRFADKRNMAMLTKMEIPCPPMPEYKGLKVTHPDVCRKAIRKCQRVMA